ncbi:MAG: sugar transferase [Sporomusaceae bacterium]|jgi:lipopolysaccharide/colanic/teichoic acid biosynthesis glycosyltransferase|nr:sugar transferase [Sporomusaceae bacterium]
MFAKRIFDLFFTIPGVVLLLPFFGIIGIWIKFDSPGSIFFRQIRVGKRGINFQMLKFRTMVADAEKKGKQITVGQDERITRCGKFLRKYKLDELPQLINVLLGEMSLVGPRPEVPKYVECYPVDTKNIVLSVPPGMTNFASLEYQEDEDELLAKSNDPELTYIQEILPVKLNYYVRYVNERSLYVDFCLILRTFYYIII